MADRYPRLGILPHRHRAVQTSHLIDLSGEGDRTPIEMCSCLAYRRVGALVWHGSHFRRRVAS